MFHELGRRGRTARTRSLWCRYISDPTAEPLRVAFAINRTVGPATTRNRLRRRLRAILAATAPTLDVSHGWLLIGATPSAAERTFDQISSEMVWLLTQTSQSRVSQMSAPAVTSA